MRITLLSVLLVLGWSLMDVASAQQAWLLLYRSGHFEVARASNGTLENIADVGELKSYGQSPRALAFLSRDTSNNSFFANIIDKSSARVTLTRPIAGYVASHMAGPVDDVVVTQDYLYFVTMRIGANGVLELNQKQGRLDFNQVALADGTLKTFPLPKECATARVANFGGIPLVYTWNGYGVWKFDVAAGTLKRIVALRDVGDVLTAEDARKQSPTAAPGPFADQVVVPGAGVFRLSKLGGLDQVLDANLNPVKRPRASVELGFDAGPDGQFAALFSGAFNGAPAIGVLGQQGGSAVFEYLNPTSLVPEWKTTLASSVDATSVIPAPANAISYVDHDKASVETTSASGTKQVFSIKALDSSADPFHVRILTLTASD